MEKFSPEWYCTDEAAEHRKAMYLVEFVKAVDHVDYGEKEPKHDAAFWYYDVILDAPRWIALKPTHRWYRIVFEDYGKVYPERLNEGARGIADGSIKVYELVGSPEAVAKFTALAKGFKIIEGDKNA